MENKTTFSIPPEADTVCYDVDSNLKIYNCDTYGTEPPPARTELSNIEQTKGLVSDFLKNNIVCKTFPSAREYNEIPDDFESEIPKYYWTIAKEITLLSLFSYENTWKIKTTRNIDAFSSYWIEEKSFGCMFVEALEKMIIPEGDNDVVLTLCSKLEPDFVYTFGLCAQGTNAYVCKQSTDVFYCGKFSKDGSLFVHPEIEPLGYVPSQPILEFKSVDEMKSFIDNLDPLDGQGILGIEHTTTTPKVIKIYNKNYKQRYDYTADVQHRIMEYLKIRNDENQLENLYQTSDDNFKDIIDEYEELIEQKVVEIFEVYKNKFIKKTHTNLLHPLVWKIIVKLHNWHKEDRENHKMTPYKVQEEVDSLSANDLRRLIRIEICNEIQQ
jgi:hypothetical protein